MNNELIPSLHQQQKLILTRDMQLFLKYLQMPLTELHGFIDNELQENPVLEASNVKESDDNPDIYGDKSYSEDDKNLSIYKELLNQSKYCNTTFENEYKYDDSAEEISPFNYISEKKSLKDYLKMQLIERRESHYIMTLCDYIIESLDYRGYLESTIQDIAEDLGVCIEHIEYCLKIVQDLQPYGIGARNLKECLKIQLKNRGIADKKIYIMIDEYLELIATNKIKEIANKLKITVTQVQKYCSIIKTLEPKPSRGFYTGEDTNYILPEAYIRKIGDEYLILLNDSMLPKLNINSFYKNIINNEQNLEASTYLKEKLSSAMLLIKGIEQRRNTIYNILKYIVDIQKNCFNYGLTKLKPMTLKDIASTLNIHESTVSRAIKDKYICTPFGTIKIRNLFSSSVVSCNDSEKISTIKIKAEIRRLIDEEDRSKPLSDQDICEKLTSIGIKVSRRTVAKYREEMGIKSSILRKELS